ncbi:MULTISPECIES: hypothetical protein [unclassified Carboxydocella]|uniref:hypothetical protein n=1 Tax=unclassified Carboxydocella TaxID=2685367 RepID=UPI0009AC56C6|nr:MULTISPECIES: hypothetical protein [unclassified Carboxydocella]GAW29855.1 hypothetical protein ULO1_24250 [Carboxydocella sp. ULO1]GAW32888.1 hypothetical protein JDF658_26530 [Carboxydocella sp. JDF658]
MTKKVLVPLLAFLLGASLLSGCATNKSEPKQEKPATETKQSTTQTQPEQQPAKKITISLTGAKNGCNDCHAPGKVIKTKDGKEKDVSLAGETKLIPNHPEIDKNALIADCMNCHKLSPEKREKFVNKIHDVHMNSEAFTVKYKQTCSGCHDMSKVKGL